MNIRTISNAFMHLLFILALSGAAAFNTFAADGDLDTGFDADGRAVTDFLGDDVASEVVQLPDGKILVLGLVNNGTRNGLARYNTDGTLDGNFGTSGEVIRPANTNGISFLHEMIFQPDGKIIAFGQGQPGPADGNYGFLVARYNVNGAPDTNFGTNGSKVIQFFYTFNTQTRVAVAQAGSGLLQTDGKIVVVGHAAFESADGLKNFALARLQNSPAQPTVNNPAQRIADFDGDGRTDASVFRNGTWLISPSSNSIAAGNFSNSPQSFYSTQFGIATDKLAPADFDGDGKTDIAVWRENTDAQNRAVFYILNSANGTVRAEQFGRTGDSPSVVGDWDGDGKADPAVYRDGASGGGQSNFYYRPSAQTNVDFTTVYWGTAGDLPVRGDFDGDAKMDAAVFRPSDNKWYILQSSNAQARYDIWGLADDKFVPADYDGDGKTDLAIFRNGVWFIKQSSTNQPIYKNWGMNTDALVPGDYDGDRQADVAVWRDGVYYILQTTNAQAAYQNFGASGDQTVASAFVR